MKAEFICNIKDIRFNREACGDIVTTVILKPCYIDNKETREALIKLHDPMNPEVNIRVILKNE